MGFEHTIYHAYRKLIFLYEYGNYHHTNLYLKYQLDI
jgi:hypothetical protein